MTKANDNLFMGVVEGYFTYVSQTTFFVHVWCSMLYSFQTIIFVMYYFLPSAREMFSQASVILSTGQTPPGQTPPWADTPGQTPPCLVHAGIHPPPRQPLQRTVRILLECILVLLIDNWQYMYFRIFV